MSKLKSVKVYIARDIYGAALEVSHRRDMIQAGSVKVRECRTWKDIVRCWVHKDTSRHLYDTAWRFAVRDGAIDGSWMLSEGESLGIDTFQLAKSDAEVVEQYISNLVNNPRSQFYIYG